MSLPERPALLAVLLGTLLAACASTGPRFPSNVAASFRQEPMRHAKSERVELYYPAAQRDAAMRLMARLDQCVERLRGLAVSQRRQDPVLVYLTTANFNNAFAYSSSFGFPRQILLPVRQSMDLFNWVLNTGTADAAEYGCHEAVHYVHAEQIEGPWRWVNTVVGDYYSPNSWLEDWFVEGLATWYETRFGHGVGRPQNPIWRGAFEAGITTEGGPQPGDLNALNRRHLPFGAAYLGGSHFVEWLAATHGEDRLWQLIDTQAHSLFSPYWVSLRFKWVYGRTLDTLVSDYRKSTAATLERRDRPEGQTVLDPDAGYSVRLAAFSDGAVVTWSSFRDDVDRLVIRDPSGKVLVSRPLVQLLPVRAFISANTTLVSGLSTAEGDRGPGSRTLYAMVVDLDVEGNDRTVLLRLDGRTGDLLGTWDTGAALGGDVSRDGKRYLFVEVETAAPRLVALDLGSGARTELARFPTGVSIASPAWSPDGARVAFIRMGESSFDVWLREADGKLRALTRDDRFDYFPRWLDDGRIVFTRELEGRAQAHVLEVATGEVSPATVAPHLAIEPAPLPGDRVAFLNRDGWSWSVDTAALPPSPRPELAIAAGAPGGDQAHGGEPGEGGEGPALLLDEPYQPFDGLLSPTLRGIIALPWVHAGVGPVRLGFLAGAMVRGSDRLGLHDYAANVLYRSGERGVSANLTYGTHLLAPWYLRGRIFRATSRALLVDTRALEVVGTYDVVQKGASLDVSRSFWTTPVWLSLHGFQLDVSAFEDQPATSMRFVGGQLSTAWGAGAGSPHGGQKVGWNVAADVGGYSPALGSTFAVGDLRLALGGSVPLPLRLPHSLRLSARGRYLPGAPGDLLQIGGVPLGEPLLVAGFTRGEDYPYPLPGGISFYEGLRGYEDHALLARGAALAGARYRLPFIIDRGTVSTFYLGPSFFVRQLEVDVFADGALTDDGRLHRAAGASIALRTAFMSAYPFSLVYQFAYRFDDGLPPLHQFALTFD